MLAVAMVAILVTMGLALVRAALGPTVFDRILALNMFGTKTVLLIAVIAFLTDRPSFLDLAAVRVPSTARLTPTASLGKARSRVTARR